MSLNLARSNPPQAFLRRLLPALPLTLLLAALSAAALAGPAFADSACPNEALREQQYSTALPDCRAYEMVSPPHKNGGQAIPVSGRTRSATDGNAVTFGSLTAFGDALGTGVATDYMAARSSQSSPGSSGWTTHSLTPPQAPLTSRGSLFGGDPNYQGMMSADLSSGVFRAWSPVTSDPLVADVQNLYVRHDLRTPGPGAYQLVTECPLCVTSPFPEGPSTGLFRIFPPVFAGASSDFRHVVFESALALTPGAPGPGTNEAYEWDNGSLRLVGVLPDGSTAAESRPGQALNIANAVLQAPDPISADGSRIVFVNTPDNSNAGDLYLRIAGRTTVQLNATERTVPDSPSPATFGGMSTDGSRIFFTTTEALTNDADASGGRLYMWAKQATDETQSVTIDATAGTFTLRVEGQTTDPITFDAAAATVQAALEALPAVGAGNVTVTGGPGSSGGTSPYLATFTSDLSGVDVTQMTADGSSLTGSASVTTTRPIHNLTFVNVNHNPTALGNEVQGVIGASDDGHYVYFVAKGQIVAGAPEIGVDAGIYVWHDGTLAYIGRSANFSSDAAYQLYGAQTFFPRQAQVTPDGRHLVFGVSSGDGLLSAHGGVDYDQSACHNTFFGCLEIYVYSADTGRLACASCNPTGAPATADALVHVIHEAGASAVPNYQSRVVSDDGHYVFFSSPEALVPADVNGHTDAYEYDTETGKTHLLSSGADPTDSYFMEVSPTGTDAFFYTHQQLIGWDRDSAGDLYDARIDGGFPEPVAESTCSGEACQGTATDSPAVTSPSTATFSGSGNPPASSRTPARKPPAASRQAKLVRALRACRRKARRQRRHCRAVAMRRYGPKPAIAGRAHR